jgi:hypothetical protein
MAANGKRHKPRDQVIGGNEAIDESYNNYAGALKQLGPIVGQLTPIGDASAAALNATQGALIAFYNPSGTVAYVKFGATNAVTAPTDGTNGIALVPNQYTIMPVPLGTPWFKASATAYAYLVADDSIFG